MEKTVVAQKRELKVEQKSGIKVRDLILIGVLLAAGAVLKYFVGSIINIAGVKPNFVIAMYCLGILLVKPKLYESAAIGLLAGAICQFLPGTPWLNFASELIGAVVMGLLVHTSIKIGKVNFTPAIATFISTLISGSVFVSCLFIFLNAEKSALAGYVPIVLGTAIINTILVQLLYIPLKLTLKQE
jgi:uncharacterized membrane protein YjjP (DUF1212 family)